MSAAPAIDLPDLYRRVTRRYDGGSRFARGYVYWKLRTDPVHAAILDLAAGEDLGDVVDIGCGHGQLGIALLEAGLARSVLGLDVIARHLEGAARAAAGLPFRTQLQDLAAQSRVPSGDTVMIIDVLHTLTTDAQAGLLAEAARAARERILVRTLDPDRGARSRLTRGMERLSRRFWPNAGRHVNPMPLSWMASRLEPEGFATESVPCWQGTPFASMLLVARRP
ncbi:class I SAM-dependent methyltransferase [Marinivivus vitaminiproducens]|uniref:class I SAM-dependent methyltransferase n=1 Tax=Marinivivus vitaminiproducens TaxID=3035935 RepID=UPI00279D76F3|nr:class I SAM-dependent methyltransferase [Geminicoccaceae bacterium SCSIO 64248]